MVYAFTSGATLTYKKNFLLYRLYAYKDYNGVYKFRHTFEFRFNFVKIPLKFNGI